MAGRMVGTSVILGLVLGGTVGFIGTESPARGKVVLVKMLDVSATEYRFEPTSITVAVGDTVRFQQTGAVPHNVEFREVPAGTSLGDAKTGPYLIAKGQTYDLVITPGFVSGRYAFVCVPHEALGMKGSILVTVGK